MQTQPEKRSTAEAFVFWRDYVWNAWGLFRLEHRFKKKQKTCQDGIKRTTPIDSVKQRMENNKNCSWWLFLGRRENVDGWGLQDCQCLYVFGVTNEATAAASSKSEGEIVLCYPAPSDITALSPSGGKKKKKSLWWIFWITHWTESLQGFRFSSWVGAAGFTPDAQSGSKKSLPSWWEPGDDVAKSNSTETTKVGLHYYNTTALGHLHMWWGWKRCGLCFDKWLSVTAAVLHFFDFRQFGDWK